MSTPWRALPRAERTRRERAVACRWCGSAASARCMSRSTGATAKDHHSERVIDAIAAYNQEVRAAKAGQS